MSRQLLELARTIKTEYESTPATDDVMPDGRTVPASKCSFRPIPATDSPSVIAYIDGGNETIMDMPFCVVTVNSPAVNSSDMTVPGYPYALIRAGQFANVRRDKASVLAMHLHSKLEAGPSRAVRLSLQHDYLNEVTGR